MRLSIIVVAAGLVLVGCGQDKPAGKDGAKADGKPATSASAKPASSAPDPEKVEVAVEEDFVDQAEKDVTPDTLDAELDKLAAEIEADTN